MANFLEDNSDLLYYLQHGVDWQRLVANTELHLGDDHPFGDWSEALEFYQDVLTMVGGLAAEAIAPHADTLDREGVRLEAGQVVFPDTLRGIFDQIKDLELHGMCLPRELGGLNCPFLVYLISSELLSRADVSVMTHNGFHGGIAMAMLMYSIEEGSTTFDVENRVIESTRFQEEIRHILTGEAWGCMDITEPGAGSDMAALRTRGTQGEDGCWTVTGQKIFITSGHGKYHFVIARTDPAAADGDGLDGLSLFLVNSYTEGPNGQIVPLATIERIEEKLGHHASPTVTLSFEDTPAQLVGERGDGFKMMLLLMNNARISVGFEALGLCESAWRMAKDYASERKSMGKTIDRHEIIADYLEEMQTDIQGIRALAVSSAFDVEIAHRTKLRLHVDPPESASDRSELDETLSALTWRARLNTPLIKFLSAEKAVEMARRCLQIHGGYGYTTEYGAEKLLRDSLVLPIYEGTSQIQALMATKDALLWALRNPTAFLAEMTRSRWTATCSTDALERDVAKVRSIALSAQRALLWRIVGRKLGSSPLAVWRWSSLATTDWNPKTDFAPALLHAEHLTQILADARICEILLEQQRQHAQRRDVLERYVERALPRCRFHLDRIRTTGDRLLNALATPETAHQENRNDHADTLAAK